MSFRGSADSLTSCSRRSCRNLCNIVCMAPLSGITQARRKDDKAWTITTGANDVLQ